MPKLTNLKSEQGHTMLEVLIAIAILSAISILTILFFSEIQAAISSGKSELRESVNKSFFFRADRNGIVALQTKPDIHIKISRHPDKYGVKTLSVWTKEDTIHLEYYESDEY